MTKSTLKKKSQGAAFFVAVAALTALTIAFIIKEGQRIKMENELLSYEVW